MRLPLPKVSFCTARAVELSRLVVVFLAVICHRILGARVVSSVFVRFAAVFRIFGLRPLPRYRKADIVHCCIITAKDSWTF